MKFALVLALAASALSTAAFAEEMTILKDVSINVCDPNLDGCASHVASYLLDTNYPAAKDFLETFKRPGEVMIEEAMGVLTKEKGHFPNPTAEFDVFKPIVIIPRPIR